MCILESEPVQGCESKHQHNDVSCIKSTCVCVCVYIIMYLRNRPIVCLQSLVGRRARGRSYTDSPVPMYR